MIRLEEVQDVIDAVELPSNFDWYHDIFNTKVFSVRSKDGGVLAVWMSILFVYPNYLEPPFDGGDFGREGLHKLDKNTWYVFEFKYSNSVEEIKNLIESTILKIK